MSEFYSKPGIYPVAPRGPTPSCPECSNWQIAASNRVVQPSTELVRLISMRRSWILVAIGVLLVAIAVITGVTPVHGSLDILANENGPGGHPSISCGSPLFKRHPAYSAPFTGLRLEGNDPCSLARDHRREPVEIAGGAGLLVLAAASVDARFARRQRNPTAVESPVRDSRPIG